MWIILTRSGSPLCWRAGVDGVERDMPIVFETEREAAEWLSPGERVVECRNAREGMRPIG